MSLSKISEVKVAGGRHIRYQHASISTRTSMQFAVFLPSGVSDRTPVLYWLSGLTCTDENFMQKAGAFKKAAQLGLAIVAPDTSPRGETVPDDPDGAYDFGLGAGFYVNATELPWIEHYQMYSYVVDELPGIIETQLGLSNKKAISGHSMGGHGALTIGLKNPNSYRSISAFSPICHPVKCPWGQKALTHYLGEDETNWRDYDASLLLATRHTDQPMLVDQGTADSFLDTQLMPIELEKAAKAHDANLILRMQEGYDHSYFFISTFIDDHLAFHAKYLNA